MTEEEKKGPSADMNTVRFVSLVSMFAASAYQSLGKIANPLTGKVERNLDSAQGMIDILLMLREKTKGNLNEDEDKVLNSTISDLQMNLLQSPKKK